MKNIYQCTKVFLLLFMLGMCFQGFAAQDIKRPCDKAQVSGNYYVPAERVYVAPDGIFILFEGQLTQVGVLCSDERGVYVPGPEMSRQFVWCPICQRWFDPDGEAHKCK